jgi:hypothetical protein
MTLEDVTDGKVSVSALPQITTPDGSPSLCGFIGSAIMAPTPVISGAGIVTVGLAATGGATLGYAFGGPAGAIIGAGLGASIAASAVQ